MTLIEQNLALWLDPALAFRAMGRVADPWQAEAMRSTATRQALLAARQVGKGEVLTAKAARRAATVPESVVGVVAPTLRQSAKLLRRVRRAIPSFPFVTAVNQAVETLVLDNGSELYAWPGNRPDLIRGDTLDLLLVDEAAYVSDDVFTVTLPMLAMSGGSAVLASTSGGPAGFLFDLFEDENDEWDLTKILATECPRYTEEALARLKRDIGDAAFDVEMMCEWREGAYSVFTKSELDDIFGMSPVPDVLPGEPPLPAEDESNPWAVTASAEARMRLVAAQ